MKTKTWMVRAVMETDLFCKINCPANWSREQVFEYLIYEGSDWVADRMQEDGLGGWEWEHPDECDTHDPDADVVEEAKS
jgi:hypothetical protein